MKFPIFCLFYGEKIQQYSSGQNMLNKNSAILYTSIKDRFLWISGGS